MDNYQALRSIHPLAVLAALGYDTKQLKKRGSKPEWSGPCPICKPKNNKTAFSIHEDGKYHCFGCGAKGRGAIDLCQALKGIGFKEAVEFLEGLKGTATAQTARSVDSVAPQSVVEETGELKPYTGKYSAYFVPNEWLAKRIPSPEILDRYGVGFYQNPARKSAYSGRVLIPFKDLDGKLWGYTGRMPEPKEGEAKYLIPSGFPKSRFIFGLRELVHERKFVNGAWVPLLPGKKVYLVESPFTVLKFASLGIPALSLYGWSVSDEQLALLKDLGRAIVYVPDKNKRSEGASVTAKLAAIGWVRYPELPDNCTDPEQLTEAQISKL